MPAENRRSNLLVKVGTCPIPDDDGALAQLLSALPPAERRLAAAPDLGPRRRAELVAGRTAARRALAAQLGEGGGDPSVARAPDGAPELVGGPPGLLVSISHAANLAVAAAGFVASLGVDLCPLAAAPRVQRVARRFLAAEEQALPANDADWATLWALKEAAAKALRSGLLEGGLRVSRVAALAPPGFAWPALQVDVETLDDPAAILAIVWS
jgi:4'-phosphopantetheinyl transferase EntD